MDKTKFLILHGFGGGIYEILPLVKDLKNLGYEVNYPTLAGHLGNHKEMRQTKFVDWIKTAEESLLDLGIDDDIVVVGFSMGGLIAFNLACKYKFKSIVTINTPIYFWNLFQVLSNLTDDLKNRRLDNVRRYLDAKKSSPIPSMYQFLLMLRHTKPKLKNTSCPILILQAKDDDTTRVNSVKYIYDNVSSPFKAIRFFDKGGHLILESEVKEEVISTIKDFCI